MRGPGLMKNTVVSVLLAVVAVIILVRVVPPSVDPVVELVISKNRMPIRSIHQSRDIESSQTVMVDRVELLYSNRFRHPELGHLGYGENFFVDIDHEFTVQQSGRYVFRIGSDDGFTAAIDGEKLCEFGRDRPYSIKHCPVTLTAGSHRFALSYFQGYGNSGLTIQYAKAGDKKLRYFGESSDTLSFD